MDVLPQASLFLGLIPALILMYIAIKGYDEFYKDKVVFITLVIGVIIGFVAAFIHLYFFSIIYLYVVLLAFFDQLFKTIILNIGRFHENRETPIYGLSLGLGFGSSFTPLIIIAISSDPTSNVYVLSLAAIGSIGIILFHGATGAYIGYGVYQGKLTKYLLIAILLELPFNFLIGTMMFLSKPELIKIQLGAAVGIIVYGVLIYWYVTRRILPKLLTQSEKRKRKKNK